MTTITIYRNNHNFNKFLEVHDDGEGHRSVRQYIHFKPTGVVNLTGDGMLHRWRKPYLQEVLEDYTEYASYSAKNPYFKKWFGWKTHEQRSHILRRMRRNRA